VKIVVVAAVFGIGYVLGSRAGRERYAQILDMTRRASRRLDSYGAHGARLGRAAGSRRRDNTAGSA